MAFLPIKVGGLSLYSTVEAASYTFVNSIAQPWVLHDHILRDIVVFGMNLDFDRAFDGLSVMIPDFDLSGLLEMTMSLLKHNMFGEFHI